MLAVLFRSFGYIENQTNNFSKIIECVILFTEYSVDKSIDYMVDSYD
jgi:hypothetical protein